MKCRFARYPWLLLLIALMAVFFVGGCGSQYGADDFKSPPAAGTSTVTSTTPVPPAAGSSYTFAVCGDNRTAGIEEGILGRITESARERGAAFIVNTGDVTLEAAPEELELYRDFTESSGMRFYTVAGNHDISYGKPQNDFEQIVGPSYFSFDYAQDHFIVLFNADDRIGIDDAQMQWYENDLNSSSSKTNTFIFTHIPVADPALDSDHVTGEKGAEGLDSGMMVVEKAAAHDNVEAFFFGHIHAYLSYRLSGIDAYVTGGAGAPLSLSEEAGGYYHYLLVTVNGDQVDVEVVKV